MNHLRYEHFTVDGDLGSRDERSQEFVRALDYGFLDPARGESLEIAQLDRFRQAGTLLTAVYDDNQDSRALATSRPVATFGDFDGSLCVAPSVVVPTRMVTEVTVAGTHRRQGILRTMMTQALERTAEQGYALAALTASEDSIYGRFGFGRAALSSSVAIDVGQGLRLRPQVREALDDSGLRVFTPSWDSFPALYEEAFAGFQAVTPGQTGTTAAFRARARGQSNPWAVKGEDQSWRPLVVVDADGRARGYAITTFDWNAEPSNTLKVVDLGAQDRMAELALWEALGATDLVKRLRYTEAPTDFFLPSALAHPRDVTFDERHDHLWIRVVDVAAAFESRGLATDGAITLSVSDPLGLAEGSWRVESRAGVTNVTPVSGTESQVPDAAEAAPVVGQEAAAHLQIDAEGLAEIYLGTVSVAALIGSGRARCASGSEQALQLLLGVSKAPRNTYTF